MHTLRLNYELVETEGILRIRFERMHFVPSGQDQPYWVVFPDLARKQTPANTRANGKLMKVKGWLGPEGYFRYMGGATRDLVVWEITEAAKPSEPAGSAGQQ